MKPGPRAVFTDPVVITGAVTDEDLALRSSIGFFLFVPPGINAGLVQRAGMRLVRCDDVSANAAAVAGRWHAARTQHTAELSRIEGTRSFAEHQRFFESVQRLTTEGRLSRIAYWVARPSE